LSILTKFGRLRAEITWFPATWGELTLLDRATLSAAVGLLTLSTSEADDDGDSPDKVQNEKILEFYLYPSHRHHNLKASTTPEKEKQSPAHAIKGKHIFHLLASSKQMS